MTARQRTDDRLDEVLAELERARLEPTWTPEPDPEPRRLVRPPAALAEARWVPSRAAVAVVALCALIAAAVFGARVLLAGRDAPVAAASAPGVSVSGTATAKPAGAAGAPGMAAGPPSSAAAAASPNAVWSVHVVGAVARPGVVTVRPGSRVADAVRAAGGLSRAADPAGINLARAVQDGEQVYVLRPGEKRPDLPEPAASGPAPTANGPASAARGGAGSSGGPGAASGTVNVNTADLSELDTLPGVGPVLAQRILDWRTEHGRFSSVDELGEVSGIGDKLLERLRPKVTV